MSAAAYPSTPDPGRWDHFGLDELDVLVDAVQSYAPRDQRQADLRERLLRELGLALAER